MQTMAGVTRPLAESRMSTLSVPSPVWLASEENPNPSSARPVARATIVAFDCRVFMCLLPDRDRGDHECGKSITLCNSGDT